MKTPDAQAGFTLVEVMVGLVIGSVALAGMAVSMVSLQRSFSAADYQMTAQNDQLRVLGYLSRDVRTASVVTIQNGGTSVSLTMPPANPSLLNLNLGPTLTSLQPVCVSLVGQTNATTVSYYLEGGQLIRDASGAQTIVAATVDDLEFTRQGSFLTTSVLFTPRFSMNPTTASQQSTRVSNCIYLQNAAPVSN